jgi:hypothetical protein
MMDSDSKRAVRGRTAHVAMLHEAITVYRSGQTGVPYDTLLAFAGPVMAHYRLELDHCREAPVEDANAGDIALLVDVLESALIFWSYFSAEAAGEAVSFEQLKSSMLGPQFDGRESRRFRSLYTAMERSFAEHGAGRAQPLDWRPPPGLADPSPADLFEDNLFHDDDGPDQPESFALFAHPLYEDPDLLTDPEALERITQLASAYWDLARLSPEDHPAAIEALAKQFGRTPADRKRIQKQAERMILRYRELFPV